MTNQLREEVARAMCVEGGFDPDEKMPNDGPRWRYYLPGADAAIAVMQARFEAMVAEWIKRDLTDEFGEQVARQQHAWWFADRIASGEWRK